MADTKTEIPYNALIGGLKTRIAERQGVVRAVRAYLRGLEEELEADARFLKQAEENRDRESAFDAVPAIGKAALAKTDDGTAQTADGDTDAQRLADGHESERLRQWAVEVLLKHGRPMGLTALYKEIVADNYPVNSRDPKQLLKRAIQSAKQIEKRGLVYWVAGVDIPAAAPQTAPAKRPTKKSA